MKRAALLLVLALMGCASGGMRPEPVGHLEITNGHFDTRRVRLFCNQTIQATVRTPTTGKTYRKALTQTCHGNARISVEYLGNRVWVSPPFRWNEGQTIRLEIGPRPAFNWVTT